MLKCKNQPDLQSWKEILEAEKQMKVKSKQQFSYTKVEQQKGPHRVWLKMLREAWMRMTD